MNFQYVAERAHASVAKFTVRHAFSPNPGSYHPCNEVNNETMKNLYRFLFAVGLVTFFTSSFALPPCQGSNFSQWDKCQGSWTWKNGDKYYGDWQNGRRTGKGTYTWAEGGKYTGEFKDESLHGQGTHITAAGSKYVGEFKDDAYNGRGILYLADGSISESGLWKDNNIVTSQYVDPNTFTRIARSFQGSANSDDERIERQRSQSRIPACLVSGYSDNCFGTYTNDSGYRYVGEWKANKQHGQGTAVFADGDKYVGEFKDGKRNGQGTYTFVDGTTQTGEWRDEKQHGQGTTTFADGRKYVGEYKDHRFSGKGIFYLANGSVSQSGIWNDDKLITSQYVDPNTFTRIAKGSTTPSAAEALRLENERKAAQLEEDRKRIEEEKRQISLERQRIEALKGQALPPCQGNDATRWTNCFGTETFRNGDKSAAEYKDGKRTGQGVFTWADGDKYVGEFKDDKRNGQGIFYLANGSIAQTGIWNDGTLASSQYVDPNSFTRIAKGNSAPSAAEAQRLENERKAAQLEEERRKFEEEKRQAALERQRIENQKVQIQVQAQVAPDNRRRLALVIGNDNYSSMPVLNNAVNDSKSMNDALKQANFEVLYYKNLNKRGMEEALYTFAQKLGKDDVGMFYFAGHGVQANGKNFLIPVAENVKKSADVQFEGIDVNRVMAYLQDSKNSLNIVVLDACRSSLPERGGMSRGLTVTEAPQGSIVAYATSPGKAASDGDGGNSPFTKNLIRVMQRKGVKIEDVFKDVRVAVARETNGEQVPQEVSQLVGDFYFRP